MEQTRASKAGKVALVTGAGRGLGLAFAQRLAADGATVVAVDREDAPDLTAALKRGGAPAADFHRVDVTDEKAIEAMARSVLEAHGGCDIIVNNAGISPNAPLDAMTLADWRRTMAVNVDSMFLICRALVPRMIERKYGRIVNITSNTLGLCKRGCGA